MGFRVKSKETASKGLMRLARRQIAKAVRDLSGKHENPDETIHGVRKRLKKIRALLRVVKPELGKKPYRRQNQLLRDVGRNLSEARDARVLVETLETLVNGLGDDLPRQAIEPVLSQLRDRAACIRTELRDQTRWRDLRSTLKDVRDAVNEWPFDKDDDWSVVEAGVRRIYEKGYQAHKRALNDTNDETLHEWRKRVKDLWHVLELFRDVRRGFFDSRVEQARELSDLLGIDHDLTVLDATLTSGEIHLEADRLGRLRAKIADRQVELRRQAFLHGPFVYDESPDAYLERLQAYWEAWRAESRAARYAPR